ncbi:right-handed parallel beta-helix repeat-containing protein [Actinokineospora sp. HUAS TT18]|uniref:right-handed parallel beta-helix repeat-containing protein n=1 Tax=Actinokineospora sp. HUAS TT18 TaxID=3447451 RepID=UPI003F51FA06
MRAIAVWTSTAVVAAAALTGGFGAAPRAHAQAGVQYYVSTTGSDATGDGSVTKPWASVQKARDAVRGQLAGMSSDITVNIAPGDYYQTSTISFTDADSGQNGFNVVYKSSGAVGSARFFGGQPVTGWNVYQGGIYRANIGAGKSLNTLYESGTRATLARYPNYQYDSAYPMAQAPYLKSTGTVGSFTQLTYGATDLAPITWANPAGASVGIWSSINNNVAWFTDKTPITAVDTVNRVLTLNPKTRYSIGSTSRYYVQGMLELLDQPGEFYYDPASGYLYYYPRTGDINAQTIIAPSVQKLVSVTGASDTARAHHIKFDGLTFGMTDFTSWFRHAHVSDGDSGEGHLYRQYDRQINLPQNRTGMVFLENTNNITITNSHLTNSGFSGIYMLFANQNTTISNNWFDHIGHSGVYIEGRYPGEGDVATQNTISNSLFAQVGELVGHGSGVYLINTSSNTLTNLEIYDSPRYAVVLDAYVNIEPQTNVYAKNNLVRGVRVHDAAQDSGDTAPIYSWGLSDSAPYLSNKWEQITVNHSWAHPSMRDLPPNGVFMDDDTSGQVFTNVQVSDSQGVNQRVNSSGSFVYTNVSWGAGFTESGMDYANIGLTSAFPYPGGESFVGDFRNGLTNWSAGKGSPSTSTAVQHSDTPSFAQSGDMSVIYNEFTRSQRKRVSLWFYDDAAQTSLNAVARVDSGGWNGAGWRGLGVKASTSTSKYVYRVDGTVTATNVPRTTGWHELSWDYHAAGVDMFIDGKLVAAPAGLTQFNTIAMGDWWADTAAGTAYWGDVVVDTHAEDFEHGLGAFTAKKGAASTSTTRAKSGSSSYALNEDTDVVATTIRGKHYEVAELWFYDDGAANALQMARVDDGTWDSSTSWRGLGVDTGVSAGNYVYRVGATTTATSVARTTGWHRLTWDYRSGAKAVMSIDGTVVAQPTGVRQFNMIAMGDWWADGRTGAASWDHLTVSGK